MATISACTQPVVVLPLIAAGSAGYVERVSGNAVLEVLSAYNGTAPAGVTEPSLPFSRLGTPVLTAMFSSNNPFRQVAVQVGPSQATSGQEPPAVFSPPPSRFRSLPQSPPPPSRSPPPIAETEDLFGKDDERQIELRSSEDFISSDLPADLGSDLRLDVPTMSLLVQQVLAHMDRGGTSLAESTSANLPLQSPSELSSEMAVENQTQTFDPRASIDSDVPDDEVGEEAPLSPITAALPAFSSFPPRFTRERSVRSGRPAMAVLIRRSSTSSSIPSKYSFLGQDVNSDGDETDASQLCFPLQDVLNSGSTYVCTYPGTSQYTAGGPSACGLASMNAVRMVLSLTLQGVRGCNLLSLLTKKMIVEDIMQLASLRASTSHLDVSDIQGLPLFASSMESKANAYSQAVGLDSFNNLFRSLLRMSNDTTASVGAVLTRPPEIIAIFVLKTLLPDNPNMFVVFDSHPRSPRHSQGAAFIFFSSATSAATYLTELFHVDDDLFDEDDWQMQHLAQYEYSAFIAKTDPTPLRSVYQANLDLLELRERHQEEKTQLRHRHQAEKKQQEEVHRREMIGRSEEHRRALQEKSAEIQSVLSRMDNLRREHSAQVADAGRRTEELRITHESEITGLRRTLDDMARFNTELAATLQTTQHRVDNSVHTIEQLSETLRSSQARHNEMSEANHTLRQRIGELQAKSLPTYLPHTLQNNRPSPDSGYDEDSMSLASSSRFVPGPKPGSSNPFRIPPAPLTDVLDRAYPTGLEAWSGEEAARLQELEFRAYDDLEFARRMASEEQMRPASPTLPLPMNMGRIREDERAPELHSALLEQQQLVRQQMQVEEENRLITAERERLLAEFAKPFDCAICLETLSEEDVAIVDPCEHRLCRPCLKEHVLTWLQDNRFPILCPLCTDKDSEVGVLSNRLAEEIGITQEDYDKWTELELAAHCVLINCRGCQSTAYVDRDEYAAAKAIACPLPSCIYVWCKQCGQEMIPKQKHTCDGTAELDRAMAENGWKACPGCNTRIEKTMGCNHITCSAPGCNMHFCYLDGQALVRSVQRSQINAAVQEHYGGQCRGPLFEYPDVQ